jgi:hypothetical protein
MNGEHGRESGTLEFHKDINVAFGIIVSTGNRAKNAYRLYTEVALMLFLELREYSLAFFRI